MSNSKKSNKPAAKTNNTKRPVGRPKGSKNSGPTYRRSLLDLSVVAFNLQKGAKLSTAGLTPPTVYRWLYEGWCERSDEGETATSEVVLTQAGIDHAHNHQHADRDLPAVFAERYADEIAAVKAAAAAAEASQEGAKRPARKSKAA